jgi:hypothetical protein
MKRLLLLTLLTSTLSYAQPWSPSGTCDFTDQTQWNNGGAKGCACTWYDSEGNLNCAFGDCGQNALYECVYDCNGHNGYATDQTPRQCDATASPYCWYNGGGGNAGELYCQGITLPIELLDFWGQSTENYNEIHWETNSELDNDYFIISYSSNGVEFNELIRVDGAGTTTTPQSYYFRHGNPIYGTSYYKLTQVDYNGESEEFPVIAINNKKMDSQYVFSDVYPNPSSDIFYFNYNGNSLNETIYVKVTNLLGKTVLTGSVDKYNNSQAIPFKLIGVEKGNYFIEIKKGEHTETKKLMVK